MIILLAVVCFAMQFAFTKLYERAVPQNAVTSTVMLIETSLIGALLFLCVGGSRIELNPRSLVYAALFALVMIPYYMFGIKVLSLGSLAVYSTFMMLGGMLVPFFYGVWFLNEEISVAKIIGTALLSVFIVLQAVAQSRISREDRKKGSWLFIILCVLIFFINGATGVIAKAHQVGSSPINEVSFTFISCALTALFSLAILPFSYAKNKDAAKKAIKGCLSARPLISMTLIGISAYVGNFLHLKAAAAVPASVQFPLVSGGVIVLSALTAATVFRERLSGLEWISVSGACICTVLFAF